MPTAPRTYSNTLAIMAVTLLIGAVEFLSWYQSGAARASQSWVDHTDRVINAVADLNIALHNAETGQRGYLLTGEDSYLIPYDAAAGRIAALEANISGLTADNPTQQGKMRAIEPLIKLKLDELAHTIRLRREGSDPDALAIAKTDMGLRTMAEIQALLAGINAEEFALLNARQAAAASAGNSMRFLGAAGGLLGIVLLAMAFHLQRLQRAAAVRQAQIDEKHKQSTERVEATLELQRVELEAQTRFRAIFGAISEGIFLIDLATGAFLEVNEPGAAMVGYTTSELLGCNLGTLSSSAPPFTGQAITEWIEKVVHSDEPQRIDWHCKAKDGRLFWAEIQLQLAMISEQKIVLAILRNVMRRPVLEQEFYTRSLIEADIDALVAIDPFGMISDVNKQMEDLAGYPRNTLIGSGFKEYFSEPKQAEAMINRTLSGKTLSDCELTVCDRDGKETAVSCNATTFYDRDHILQGVFVSARDITERKKTDRKTALLLDELDHRVKNILAVVSAVVSQTLKPGHTAQAYATEVEARIKAIAAAHNLLTQSEVRAEVSLRAIVTTELAPYDHDRGAIDFTITGPDVTVAPKAALGVAMAIHELASNAAKYGALSTSSGRLAIAWEITDNAPIPTLTLTWTESGGPRVQPPTRRGYGSTLIEEALTYNLQAKVTREFSAAGIRCTIAIPMEEIAFIETAGELSEFDYR